MRRWRTKTYRMHRMLRKQTKLKPKYRSSAFYFFVMMSNDTKKKSNLTSSYGSINRNGGQHFFFVLAEQRNWTHKYNLMLN